MSLMVDIEKRLGDFHLRVKWEAGDDVLSLLGPSGCGKSVTLQCIAGIQRPDRGQIVLDGVTLFDSTRKINLPPQKRRVGYLFQQYALFPHMTVWQNMCTGLRQKDGGEERIREMLRAMRLEGMERRRPHQLSGGQQQRLALARILVNEPEVLLLDEPFSALDSQLRFQLEEELRQVIRRFGKTVVLVSHNREEVYRLSRQVVIMAGGAVDAAGTREEIFAHPQTRNGALMTGCRNISAAGTMQSGRIPALDWGAALQVPWETSAPFVGIRPQDIRPDCGENTVRCRVAEVIENPFTVLVRLTTPGGTQDLWWELDKNRWAQNCAEEIDISLPPEKLLALR